MGSVEFAQSRINLTEAFRDLVQIGIALASEHDLARLLEMILTEARRFTRAEAGTLFLRDEDLLRVAVVQNDHLARSLGEPQMKRRLQGGTLKLDDSSVEGRVALGGDVVNIRDTGDTGAITPSVPYTFVPLFDTQWHYTSRAVLLAPLQDAAGNILGVLELINPTDDTGRTVPFDGEYEALIRSLGSQAAVAILNARLEDLSFKDPLTNVYNRRYFTVRIEEETRRHARFGEPVSLVLLDLDRFKEVNDRFGHRAGDETLQELAQLLLRHSRSFSIVTRFGGDEFAILLVNTPKAGAVTYAHRVRELIARHRFGHGSVTVSLGVASLPEDVGAGDDLVVAADTAMYEAKRLGRNRVAVP